jgi:hypothetical protein
MNWFERALRTPWGKVLLAAAVALGCGAFAVLAYRDGELLAAGFIGLFAVIFGYASLVMLAEQRLVRAMRATAVTAAAPPSAPAEPVSPGPGRAVAADVPLTFSYVSGSPELPPAAQELAGAIERRYQAMLARMRRRTWLALALAFVIALVGFVSGDGDAISGLFLLAVLIVAGLTIAFRRVPTRAFRQLTWALLWARANGLALAVTAYVAVATVFDTGFTWAPAIAALAGWAVGAALRLGRRRALRRQAAEARPLDVLILWVFDASEASMSLVGNFAPLWSASGRVRLLRGGGLTAMPRDVGRWLTGRAGTGLAATVADVEARMAEFDRAGLHRDGYYVQQMLLCGDASWEHALKQWLVRPTLILMSLAGFSRKHAGCITEIRRLVHEIPLSRCVFLVDGTTDRSFLETAMRDAWASRPAASPNATAAPLVQLLELTAKGVGQHAPGPDGREANELDDPQMIDQDVDRMAALLALAAVRSGLYPPQASSGVVESPLPAAA